MLLVYTKGSLEPYISDVETDHFGTGMLGYMVSVEITRSVLWLVGVRAA